MSRKTAALLISGGLALAGCASDQTAASPGDDRTGAGTVVDVVDFAFEPEAVTVPVGTTVEWAYREGGSRHTVTFDARQASGDLEPGDAYTRTFEEAGAHPYACFFHPDMTGTVTVRD